MLDAQRGASAAASPSDLTTSSSAASSALSARRQAALDRIQQLVTDAEAQGLRSRRWYFRLQIATVGLAALTPCFIILAKESPGNVLFNWLQLFLPALAAIAAGLSHVFRWREDAVRYTTLAEGIRSQLWRFQTRSGEYFGAPDDQALDKLVIRVDDLNLQSVARWSGSQLADAAPAAGGAAPPRGEARA